MKSTRSRLAVALQMFLLLTAGSAYATDFYNGANHAAPLNLRMPPLDKVMQRGDLLAEMGDDPVAIVVEPPLLPMTSDADAPLGIVDSLRWSADHPTQAWRLLLPANDVYPYD
jgi:hypothetical protein